jgi:hypothetical protein
VRIAGPLDRGEAGVQGAVTLLGCYHPSQQNTFTGRLTESMFDQVWDRARILLQEASRPGGDSSGSIDAGSPPR